MFFFYPYNLFFYTTDSHLPRITAIVRISICKSFVYYKLIYFIP